METLEYIDNYFTIEPSAVMKEEFEKRITNDPVFAEEVAFYISMKQAAAEQAEQERNNRFKEVYALYKKDDDATVEKPVVRRLWKLLAVAAILSVIIFGWNAFLKPASLQQLADKYVQENFQTLSVTMGGKEDSLQTGFRLYNEGKLNEAFIQFENIAKRDTSSFEAKKYAGIVSLRLSQYDKAIVLFSQLENYTQLYANPGKFYHAITLLKRNQPGDKEAAKTLLEDVIQYDREGKEDAQQLLNKW